jgi:hypothetical protein
MMTETVAIIATANTAPLIATDFIATDLDFVTLKPTI